MRSEAFRIVEDICFSKSNHPYRSMFQDIEIMGVVAYQDLGRPA